MSAQVKSPTTLTDKKVRDLPLAERGRRYEVRDDKVGSLVVRVSPTNKSYMFYAKIPGGRNHVRRAIGSADRMSVEQARTTAYEWHELIRRGVDPRDDLRRKQEDEEARRREEARRTAHTFAAVAEEFIAVHLADKRHGKKDASLIRRELIPAWGERPIADIRRSDVIALIERIAASGRRRTAHLVFGLARSLFGWAVRRDTYGLEASPCYEVRAQDHAGKKKYRSHTLTDEELVALWAACGKLEELGDPHGALTKLLLLTGARRNEVGGASWSEFSNLGDPARAMLIVPEERYKQEAEHRMPLSAAAVAVLSSVPRPEKRERRGDFVFSTTVGERPVGDFSSAKQRLDEEMEKMLGAPPKPWVLHDLRRTFRTKLGNLGVRLEVAERALGHAVRDPVVRTYDQGSYEREIREAMKLWADHLAGLVGAPPPDNVVKLSTRRGA